MMPEGEWLAQGGFRVGYFAQSNKHPKDTGHKGQGAARRDLDHTASGVFVLFEKDEEFSVCLPLNTVNMTFSILAARPIVSKRPMRYAPIPLRWHSGMTWIS